MTRPFICFLLSTFVTVTTFSQDTITKADLNISAKVMGLKFSEPELDSMLGSVKFFEGNFEATRKYPLDNGTPSTLAHSPVLPGMVFSKVQNPVQWNIPLNVALPKNENELAYYSILKLASLIKNRKITSVELTQFFIRRLKKFGDTLQCVISFTEDIAMKEARQADKEIAEGKYRGPLHGIPYGLKDLFSVKGTKTTWGAEPFKNQVREEDAFVYSQLHKAGAVLIAKLTLGALALGDVWFGGRTNNPWDLKRGSSGSSAGSASATVAGLVPFAIGTETLGSIISPSSTCGATGLRPTFGSISRSGAMTLCWSLDKAGPICRSAEDAAVVFNYLHGTDGLDASAVNMPFNYTGTTNLKKLKIGYAKNYFDKDTSVNDLNVLEIFRKMGVQLIPVNFPDSGVYYGNLVRTILFSECGAAFDDFSRSNQDDLMTKQNKSDWPNTFRTARFIPAVEYINANRHRYLLMKNVNQTFQQFDVIIVPTFFGNQLQITNLTGHPALCMPNGFNKFHLPTSITFLGKLYGEANLLMVGKAFQNATGFNEIHPEMFK